MHLLPKAILVWSLDKGVVGQASVLTWLMIRFCADTSFGSLSR